MRQQQRPNGVSFSLARPVRWADAEPARLMVASALLQSFPLSIRAALSVTAAERGSDHLSFRPPNPIWPWHAASVGSLGHRPSGRWPPPHQRLYLVPVDATRNGSCEAPLVGTVVTSYSTADMTEGAGCYLSDLHFSSSSLQKATNSPLDKQTLLQ